MSQKEEPAYINPTAGGSPESLVLSWREDARKINGVSYDITYRKTADLLVVDGVVSIALVHWACILHIYRTEDGYFSKPPTESARREIYKTLDELESSLTPEDIQSKLAGALERFKASEIRRQEEVRDRATYRIKEVEKMKTSLRGNL